VTLRARRKHALAMGAEGLANPSARLFSNPAGDYGSMVNERVGAASWDSGAELGDTWASRNAFSYGRRAPDLACRLQHARLFECTRSKWRFIATCTCP
jgi:cobalamin biosynthesis Mg chelatase CobN